MLRYITLFVFLFIGTSLSAQSLKKYIKKNYPNAQEIEQGLYATVHTESEGEKPKAGDYILVTFKGTLLDGTVFDESGEEPFVFQLGRRQVIKGWDKGLTHFPVESEITLLLAPEMAYYKTGAGKLVPPNTPVKFDIKILKILNEKEYDAYMIALEKKERERYLTMIEERFKADKKAIHEYCMENKLKVKRSQQGVSYQVTKKGTDAYPKKGDIVTLQYKGYLVNGTVFDKSTKKKPFQFEVRAKKVIQGLDDAIIYFNKGAEGYIVIPSKLAYGAMEINEKGVQIPPHSVLIFKVKVLDIQGKK